MTKKKLVPIHSHKVEAGFPSPADNYIEKELDLKDYLIKNPDATFLVKAKGDSMKNIGIFSNDILVVDKSLEVKNNSVIIISIDGELTVKRLIRNNIDKCSYLKSENSNYSDIKLNLESDMKVWGVVVYSIHCIA